MRPTVPRLMLAAAAGLLPASFVAAQNPPNVPSGTGGWASRFIPRDLFLRMQERPESAEAVVVVTAPADSVWAALKSVLGELRVPIGFEDRAAGEIGHAQAKLFRQMGKQRLSSYLRCGSGLTGPNADSYQVFLSFVAFMQTLDDGRVAVAPFLTAHAVDPTGSRGDAVLCTSTGRLESALERGLRTQLGQPAP